MARAEACHRDCCGERGAVCLGLRTDLMGLRTDPVVGLEWSGCGRGHVVQGPLDPHPGVHEAVVLEHQHRRRAPCLASHTHSHQSSVFLVGTSWKLIFRASSLWKQRMG